jgi:hypothetical protein
MFQTPITDGRVTSAFSHSNDLGAYLVTFIPLLFCLSLRLRLRPGNEPYQKDANVGFLGRPSFRILAFLMFVVAVIILGADIFPQRMDRPVRRFFGDRSQTTENFADCLFGYQYIFGGLYPKNVIRKTIQFCRAALDGCFYLLIPVDLLGRSLPDGER